jgi:NACHT domain
MHHICVVAVGDDPSFGDIMLHNLFQTLPSNPSTKLTERTSRKGRRTEGNLRVVSGEQNLPTWTKESSDALWVSGGPGQGKTILAMHLTAQLLKQSTSEEAVLAHFCDSTDHQTPRPDLLLSFVCQLLDQREDCWKSFQNAYAQQGYLLFQDSGFESLWQAFEGAVERTPRVKCIFDGLDE